MVTIFQCICGTYLQAALGMDRAICPFCGTIWEPNVVRLIDGTVYDIRDNGRWVTRQTREPVISSWKPTNVIFGE